MRVSWTCWFASKGWRSNTRLQPTALGGTPDAPRLKRKRYAEHWTSRFIPTYGAVFRSTAPPEEIPFRTRQDLSAQPRSAATLDCVTRVGLIRFHRSRLLQQVPVIR